MSERIKLLMASIALVAALSGCKCIRDFVDIYTDDTCAVVVETDCGGCCTDGGCSE